MSIILSIDPSILSSTESEALDPKSDTSFFKESITLAEVEGNSVSISVENIMPPKIKIPAIMPNFMNI